MSIIKSKHASNYTVLPNDIFNSGLSIEAIGLLASLLKLPNDWVIQKSYLHTQLNMGREKLDRVFKELQDKGFILSVKQYDDKGRFTYNHIVYDVAYNGEKGNIPNLDNPYTIEPSTEKPSTVNLQLQSKDKQSKELLNKEIQNKDNINTCFSFLDFWNLYPNKNNKKGCESKYKKLNESQRAKISATLPSFLAYKPFASYTPPHPLTYLNQERWEDEIKVKDEKIIKWD